MSRPELLLDDGACRVARRGNVFVQYRWGKLTNAALEVMATAYEEMAAASNAPLFGVVVLAPDADVPSAAVRVRQREVLARIARDGRMQIALVIEGTGVFSHLGRSIVTSMTPDALCYHDVSEAAAALARHPGAPSAEAIAAAVALATAR
ncbi:MAG TPA: hypothetical protein VIF62_37615 [Labilithrix sp.]|jgi:hypothetical protein